MGICNLCKEEKELINKSHIIPDFMYRNSGMYDEKHRMNSFTKEDILNNRKIIKLQTGVYDGGILCAKCDNELIAQYEKYASMAIYGQNIQEEFCPDCINYGDTKPVFTICKNVDYEKYKLFLLSILFRASLSKDDFFNEVSLSNENSELLRQMIYNGNPGNHNDFPFLVSTFASSEEITPDIFINPARVYKDGFVTYTFVFAGMSYIFYEGTGLDTSSFDFLTMKSDNVLKIFHFN